MIIIRCYKTISFNCKLDERTLLSRELEGSDNVLKDVRDLDEDMVDCEWEEWRIGECSKTCGGGERINIRNKKIDATNGGKECSGNSTVTDSCNKIECPGKS